MNQFQIDFTKGYTCAIACIMKDHDCEQIAIDAYKANFHTVKELQDIGVAESDIEILKPIIKEIERSGGCFHQDAIIPASEEDYINQQTINPKQT